MSRFFKIKTDIGVFEKIIIFDSNGKVVFIEETNLPELLINVNHFSHGIYILKIISSEGTIIKKILKN
jgi:ribosomal protein S6